MKDREQRFQDEVAVKRFKLFKWIVEIWFTGVLIITTILSFFAAIGFIFSRFFSGIFQMYSSKEINARV